MEFRLWDFQRSRFLKKKASQREIAREGDLEIRFAVENGDGMNAIGDERGNFIGGASVMGLQRGEEEVVAGGLRGLHRKEIGAGNRFRERSVGIRAVQRIGHGMRSRSGAVGLCGGEDFFDEGGRNKRTGGIMDCDEIRWIRGEGLEAVEHRGAAIGSASDDFAELGKRSSEFCKFRDALWCAHQHGAVDSRAVLKGAQRPFENRPTAKWSREFIEPHAGARAGGDKDGCDGHGW